MRILEKVYQRYGRYVARYPESFLLIPIVVTLLSSIGLFKFHSENDVWDIYSPLNGLCRAEEKALERYEYASSAHHYRLQVLVNRKDGGNLMNDNDLEELLTIHKFVANNVTVSDGINYLNYRDICGIYCNDSNNIILSFIQAIIDTNGESSALVFTYPNALALQKHLFLGYSVGDLHRSETDATLVNGFKLFILNYMVNLDPPYGRKIAKNFEAQLRTLFTSAAFESQNLEYALISKDREMEEQRKITLAALPFLGVTCFVLTAFMVISLIDFPLSRSQHVEAIFAVLSPSMALVTSAGLLWGIGFPFSNILTVVPFLVITIGVDDAFLILAAWRHSDSSDLETRIGESLARSGASVTVTSLTDVLCFAVGLFSNLPAVRLFCLYASTALTIDFIYQMTFFAAIVVYCGKQQMKKTNGKQYYEGEKANSRNILEGPANKQKVYSMGVGVTKYALANVSSLPQNISSNKMNRSRTLLQHFINFLHLPLTKCIAVAAFIAHITVSCYLCTQVNTDFKMENLYLKDSPLSAISRQLQRFVLSEAFVVNFGMYPMPNFADVFIRDKFDRMVEELETIPNFGTGPDGTVLWTREFADAVAFWGEEGDFWKQDTLLEAFREYGMEEKFLITEKRTNGVEVITGFFWLITYHNMSNFLDVQKLMQIRRSILAKYSKFFNVSSHHPLEKVPTESAASAPSNFIQTAVSALILMAILVYFFISDLCAVLSVVVSILSISLGTLAYLHLWDVRLDAVSLISMLMSVGFSVDYSAHVCYHYFVQKENGKGKFEMRYSKPISIIVGSDSNVKQLPADINKSSSSNIDTRNRLLVTFKGVGWPVLQAGLSTLLGMLPMTVVRAYMVAVFWKTVILVTVLGMFHALILLPVLFLIFSDLKLCLKRVYQ